MKERETLEARERETKWDVPHHGRFDPISPRKEEPELGSPIVSYKGPNTGSMAKFVPLVTHLDGKETFRSLKGNWSRFRSDTSELKISATRGGSNSVPQRWLPGATAPRHRLMTPIFLSQPFFSVERVGPLFPYMKQV